MSEQEKSLREFACDVYAKEMLGSPYHGSAQGEQEAALVKTAQAVAARVREECAAFSDFVENVAVLPLASEVPLEPYDTVLLDELITGARKLKGRTTRVVMNEAAHE